MTDRAQLLVVGATSVFAIMVTAFVCAVLSSTGSSTTGPEALAMALTGLGSLLLVGAVCVLTRPR